MDGSKPLSAQLVTICQLFAEQKNVMQTFSHMIRFSALWQHYNSNECIFRVKQNAAKQTCPFCLQLYLLFTSTKSTTAPSLDAVRKQLSRVFVIDFFIYLAQHAILQHSNDKVIVYLDNPRSESSDEWIDRIYECLADLFGIDCTSVVKQDGILAIIEHLQKIDYDANSVQVATLKRFYAFIATSVQKK